jgi:putative ATP-binding cassette transporter
MTLVDLLNREATISHRNVLVALLVSGGANTVILAVINEAARTVSYEALNARLLAIFLVAMALYIAGLKYTFDTATHTFEQVLARVRVRVVEKIASSELVLLHRIDRARIIQCLTRDTALISDSQGLLVAAAHSLVMVLCTAVYVFILSPAAFLTDFAVIVAGILIYLARQREMTRLLRRFAAEEVRLIGITTDLMDGLKEIKLSRARGRDVLADLRVSAVALRDSKIETTSLYNQNAVFAQSFFYILIAIIVFVLPRLVEGFSAMTPELVAVVLFIIGPLSTIVTATPALTQANRAAGALIELETEIDRATSFLSPVGVAARPLAFRHEIECRGLEFRYPSDDPLTFHVGPIDLAIRHGEITMIVGGNGSGKTTFLKVLAGLYAPTVGALMVDGELVSERNLQDYRELFGAIYNDFHLFRKLYGVPAEAAAIEAELDRMRIIDKVTYGADGFSTLDLSSGQRKRIAMAVLLLEDRPILIFDEWAAEQDPDFRRFFYEALLPELKARGRTLVVATHDDRYFGVADMVVTMEQGRVNSIRGRAAP